MFQLSGAEVPQVARTKLRVTLRSLVGSNYEQVHPLMAHLLGMEAEPGPSKPDAATTESSEGDSSRATSILKEVPVFAALLAGYVFWECCFKGAAILVLGLTLPLWGPFYLAYSQQKEKERQQEPEQQEQEQEQARDSALRRLEPLRLASQESASAVL